MSSETILGIETFWAACISLAGYFSIGVWIFWDWATHDETLNRPWRWGDASRRPRGSFEARVLEHIGGVAVFLSILVFGLSAVW